MIMIAVSSSRNESERMSERHLPPNSGGVGGEAWSCDGQTNGIIFIQFVCPSPCSGVRRHLWPKIMRKTMHGHDDDDDDDDDDEMM